MRMLPEVLVAVNRKGMPAKGTAPFEHVLLDDTLEWEWDEIIIANSDALASALRSAEMLGPDSELHLLDKQLANIDILFAETSGGNTGDGKDSDDWGDFVRFVMVEDKRAANTHAKRTVLAQIIDYADTAQRTWTAEYLKSIVPKERSAWIDRNREQIEVACREGDFLLVIAGDEITDDLLMLTRRFSVGRSPIKRNELCLVSMPMYRRGAEQLLIPHVVSVVERQQRELTIRVEVREHDGKLLPVRMEGKLDQDPEKSKGGARFKWNEPEFVLRLQKAKATFEPIARQMIDFMHSLEDEGHGELWWGTGPVTGAVIFKWTGGSEKKCSLFGINTDGEIGIFYGDMVSKLAAARYGRVMKRLQRVPGMSDITARAATGETAFNAQPAVAYPLRQLLSSDDALAGFQDAIREIVAQPG